MASIFVNIEDAFDHTPMASPRKKRGRTINFQMD